MRRGPVSRRSKNSVSYLGKAAAKVNPFPTCCTTKKRMGSRNVKVWSSKKPKPDAFLLLRNKKKIWGVRNRKGLVRGLIVLSMGRGFFPRGPQIGNGSNKKHDSKESKGGLDQPELPLRG